MAPIGRGQIVPKIQRTPWSNAGAWAGLGILIYCPATEYHHLLVGHVLPIAALTLLGLAAIPRALRP